MQQQHQVESQLDLELVQLHVLLNAGAICSSLTLSEFSKATQTRIEISDDPDKSQKLYRALQGDDFEPLSERDLVLPQMTASRVLQKSSSPTSTGRLEL